MYYALPHSTVNLNGGEIQGDKQNIVERGGGIYAFNAIVNVNGGIISGHSATYGGGKCAIESNVSLKGGSIAGNKSGRGSGVYLDMSNLFMIEEKGKAARSPKIQ